MTLCTPSTTTAPTSAHAEPTTWPSSRRTIPGYIRRSKSCLRTGHLPRTNASLRNLAISTFRQNGEPNIAAALRNTSRDYRRPLSILGLT